MTSISKKKEKSNTNIVNDSNKDTVLALRKKSSATQAKITITVVLWLQKKKVLQTLNNQFYVQQ